MSPHLLHTATIYRDAIITFYACAHQELKWPSWKVLELGLCLRQSVLKALPTILIAIRFNIPSEHLGGSGV